MRLHVTVSGWVQGVGFRWFVMQQAQRLGINGWVKNLPNGRVETMAEGSADDLNSFLSELKRGPSYARIDNVEETWSQARGGLRGFDVTY